MEQKMFCYQCQEKAGCKGCTVSGVCGKKPDVAAMQDLLVYVTKGLSAVTTRLRAEGQAVDKGRVSYLLRKSVQKCCPVSCEKSDEKGGKHNGRTQDH